jgi:thiamine pyrophosphate-dependent acetolactate synthase large subunit-like protein
VIALREALAALRAHRRDDDVVVTTMAAAREWMELGAHPLDLVLVPSSMGQATSFALGIALAQPQRRVIVCNGDGSMLMNLGSLVSIVAAAPPNLAVIVFDNGVYEVTGAQPVPAAGAVDYEMVALGCGFARTHRYSELAAWEAAIPDVLGAAGPTFVTLDTLPEPGRPGPRSPGPAGERGRLLREALRFSRGGAENAEPSTPSR